MPVPRSAPWSLLLFLATGGPVLASLLFALDYSLGGIGLLSQGWTLSIWRAVLGDAQTWISLAYSAYIALASLGLSLVLALAIVFALGPRLRLWPLRSLLYVPLAMPPMVAALVTVQLFAGSGILARLAYALGWISQPADFPAWTFAANGAGILLAHIGLVTPFLVLLFDRLRRSERVDALVQLARTLGASRAQSLLAIAIPVLLTAARPALTVYLIALAGAFEIPLMVGAQSPAMTSVLIWNRFAQFDLATKPQAYALAALYAAIMMGVLLLARPSAGRAHRSPA
jgi:putative spermidine/putrescine transport system permease protein